MNPLVSMGVSHENSRAQVRGGSPEYLHGLLLYESFFVLSQKQSCQAALVRELGCGQKTSTDVSWMEPEFVTWEHILN